MSSNRTVLLLCKVNLHNYSYNIFSVDMFSHLKQVETLEALGIRYYKYWIHLGPSGSLWVPLGPKPQALRQLLPQ